MDFHPYKFHSYKNIGSETVIRIKILDMNSNSQRVSNIFFIFHK